MADRRYLSRFAAAAERDIEQIIGYLRARSPGAAAKFADALLGAVEAIEANPEIGQVAADLLPAGRYRHWVVRPYRLIYRFDGSEIVVVRCWDARRNPADLKVADHAE